MSVPSLCCCDKDNCLITVPGYKNVSTMADEVSAQVEPFVRWDWESPCTAEKPTCRQLGQSSGGEHCAEILTDERVIKSFPPNSYLGNTFAPFGDVALNNCGYFKSADGVKNWHGAFPFSHDENGIDCGFPWKKWNSETNTYDFHETDIGGCVPNRTNVKYLSCRRTVETSLNMVSYLDGIKYESIYTYTSDVTRTIEVNSGVVLMTKHTYEETGSVDPEHGVYFGNIRTQPYRKGFFIENIEHNRCGWGQVFNVGDPDNPALLTNDPDLSEYDSGVYGVITVDDVFRSDTELRYEKSWSATDSGNGDPRDAGSGSLKIKITLFDPYTTNDVLAHAENLASEWHLGGLVSDHLWRRDEQCYEAVEVMRDEKSAVSPLDYLVVEVQDLSIWPLDPEIKRDWFDDAVYYWPYYPPTNATEAGINALGLLDHGFYTGTIIGKPLPTGYGESSGGSKRGSFDHFFQNWYQERCPNGNCLEGVLNRGWWTPPYLPANAQRWTRHNASAYTFVGFTNSFVYPCPFVKATNAGVHLRKMVEKLVSKPRYDFTRPHTFDRYLLEQPANPEAIEQAGLGEIYYISEDYENGTLVTLRRRDGFPATSLTSFFNVGDWVGPIDGPEGLGFYVVNGYNFTNTSFHIGPLQLRLPTGWSDESNDSKDATRAIGKIRFKDAPGFSGKLPTSKVPSAIYNSGTAYNIGDVVTVGAGTITYVSMQDNNTNHQPDSPASSPSWWRTGTCLTYAARPCIQTGDRIILNDGTNWNDNGSGHELIRLSDTRCYIAALGVNVEFIVPFAYLGRIGGQRLSGTNWELCDTTSRGDYVTRQWLVNTDSDEEEPYSRPEWQHNLSVDVTPQVAGFSPNEVDEDFDNANIIRTPTNINNANVWIGEVEQWMVSPLWQQPHKPFNPDSFDSAKQEWLENGLPYSDIRWNMDDGGCIEDHTEQAGQFGQYTILYRYYRMPEFFESRLSPPSGCPALPTYPELSVGCRPLPPLSPEYEPGLSRNLPVDATYPADGRIKVNNCSGRFELESSEKPWGIYLRQKACVCAPKFSEGRGNNPNYGSQFKEEYAANKVGCQKEKY